jgi:3-oxoacyl-[acyl-carrier-protein] synthase-3
MRSVIIGTGIGLPPHIVTNEALSRLMDTSDEWIRVRSGIQERRYAEPGQGSTDLGVIAAGPPSPRRASAWRISTQPSSPP